MSHKKFLEHFKVLPRSTRCHIINILVMLLPCGLPQALTWLSVKVMTESLRRRKMRAVGSTAACGAPGVPPAPAGSSGDGSSEGLEAAHGSSSGVASNTSGDGRLEVFVDPGEELGSGIHGIVWAGM